MQRKNDVEVEVLCCGNRRNNRIFPSVVVGSVRLTFDPTVAGSSEELKDEVRWEEMKEDLHQIGGFKVADDDDDSEITAPN